MKLGLEETFFGRPLSVAQGDTERCRPRCCSGRPELVEGSKSRWVEELPAGGAEPERLQPLLGDLGRVDLREPEGLHASRAELREQVPQTGSTIVEERAER